MAPSHQCLSLLALTAALLLSSQWPLVNADSERKIDCRRIVFHPYCRGISAKRASLTMMTDQEKNDAKNEEEMEQFWADMSNRNQNRMPDKSQSHQHRSHSMVDSGPSQHNQVDNSVKPNDYYMSIPNYDPNGSFRRSDPYYQSQVGTGQWPMEQRREYNSGYYRGGGGPRWNGPFNSGPQTERLVRVVEYVQGGPRQVQYPSEQYRIAGRQNRILYQPYQEHLKRRFTQQGRVPRHYPSAPYDLDYVPYRRQRQY